MPTERGENTGRDFAFILLAEFESDIAPLVLSQRQDFNPRVKSETGTAPTLLHLFYCLLSHTGCWNLLKSSHFPLNQFELT